LSAICHKTEEAFMCFGHFGIEVSYINI